MVTEKVCPLVGLPSSPTDEIRAECFSHEHLLCSGRSCGFGAGAGYAHTAALAGPLLVGSYHDDYPYYGVPGGRVNKLLVAHAAAARRHGDVDPGQKLFRLEGRLHGADEEVVYRDG